MFTLRTERVFQASHAVTIAGTPEEVHAHDWRVRLIVEGPTLDQDGLLCDFHHLEQTLDAALSPFRSVVLNATDPFDRLNPSAEHVAQHLLDVIEPELPVTITRASVAVTEAPGCEAQCSREIER